MPKYDCYIKTEILCRFPDIEAENEEEAMIFAKNEAQVFLADIQGDHINDDVVVIESYEQVGDVEIYKEKEDEE